MERNPDLWITLSDGRRALISPHSIKRYVERVREVGHDVALREIRELIDRHCTLRVEPPDYADDHRSGGWWLVAGDVAFRLWLHDDGMLSVQTVLTRGRLDPEHRARRNARRSAERARRRAVRGTDPRAREDRRARRDRHGAVD